MFLTPEIMSSVILTKIAAIGTVTLGLCAIQRHYNTKKYKELLKSMNKNKF